jgi:Ca2+-transporting ATPase
MSSLRARVTRDGKEEMIDSAGLVPGDIIRLEAGDFVPADARLISSASLKSEESALTGESVPTEKDSEAQVDKKAPLGDRTNMVFSGCSITYGSALAVVIATGMNTEMGKIAGMLENESDTATPLQQKLYKLGRNLGIIALLACAGVFIIGVIDRIPILEIFMTAISLAVSAIPEGLPAIVTIVLSIGVQRMVKRNAIIRRLPAVETLGGASVICSDKTGTLTQNRMTLVKAYVDGYPEPEDISDNNSEPIIKLLIFGTLCSDGAIAVTESGVEHLGDPTETSIVYAAYRNKLIKEQINEKYPRLAVLPFDSDRKLMTPINRIENRIVVIVKGAFDMLTSRCIHGDISAAEAVNNQMAGNALRVIAIAYKEIDEVPEKLTPEKLESG